MDDQDDDRHSRAPEPDDLVRICRALNEAGARYLLIGGFAVVAHGAGRFTKDIDLLIDDSPENVARVKQALAVLEDNAAREVDDEDVRNYTVVRVADEVIVDLMGRACGLSYSDAAAYSETIERDGGDHGTHSRHRHQAPGHLMLPRDRPRGARAGDGCDRCAAVTDPPVTRRSRESRRVWPRVTGPRARRRLPWPSAPAAQRSSWGR